MIANAQIVTSTSNLVKSIDNATISYDQPAPNLISTSAGNPWEIISYTRTIAINRNGNNISTLFNYGGGLNFEHWRDARAFVINISAGLRLHYSDTFSQDITFGGGGGPLINYNGLADNYNIRTNLNINKFVVGLCFVPAMCYGRYSYHPGGSITLGFRF